jgi:monoterpene epsilon-lactone hydrolase
VSESQRNAVTRPVRRDPLLDDSMRMAERMRAAGCQVELEIWPRMPHTWQVWARVLPEARAAIGRIGALVQSKM